MKKLLFILPLLLLFGGCTTVQEKCEELSGEQKRACICAKIVCFNGCQQTVDGNCMAMCMGVNATTAR